MKLPIPIETLLHGKAVEWERLEFKAGWNPLEVLHTLCAFANDFHNLGGGYIVVGVAERNGQPMLPPAGIAAEQMNAIQKEILNLGHSAIQPQYHPIVVPEVVDGKHIMVLKEVGSPLAGPARKLSMSDLGLQMNIVGGPKEAMFPKMSVYSSSIRSLSGSSLPPRLTSSGSRRARAVTSSPRRSFAVHWPG